MTKFIALTAAALIASGSAALANTSSFGVGNSLDAGGQLDLGTVRAAGDGMVEVFTYSGGELRNLLGSAPVHAGANTSVTVPVGYAPDLEVIAVLTIDGQIAAQRVYDINN